MCGAAGAMTVASRISMNMAPATSSAKPRETPPAGARGTGPPTPSATVDSLRRARITGGFQRARRQRDPPQRGPEVGKPGQSSPDRVKTEVVALSR